MKEFFLLIPRRLISILLSLSATAFMLFFVAQALSVAYEPIAKLLPVSQEDVKNAERRFELERLRLATESLLSNELEQNALYRKLNQSKVEAERLKQGLPALPTDESTRTLERLADIATRHLPTLLAIMFAAIMLPAFADSREPWKLAMVISAMITLSGTFALASGTISPSSADIRLNVFSLTVSTTSMAVMLTVVGAVLTGFSLFMMRPTRASPGTDPADTASSSGITDA